MKQTSAPIVNRYNFAWTYGVPKKKKFKVHLIDTQETSSPDEQALRDKGKFRRFLVRLRSD